MQCVGFQECRTPLQQCVKQQQQQHAARATYKGADSEPLYPQLAAAATAHSTPTQPGMHSSQPTAEQQPHARYCRVHNHTHTTALTVHDTTKARSMQSVQCHAACAHTAAPQYTYNTDSHTGNAVCCTPLRQVDLLRVPFDRRTSAASNRCCTLARMRLCHTPQAWRGS